jgi:cytochrome c peroxidase
VANIARDGIDHVPAETGVSLSKVLRSIGALCICLGPIFLASTFAAKAPDLPPDHLSLSDQEPITPVPSPAPADSQKLELGKLLFEDTRLSHDGSRACISCHDTRTNGASARRYNTAPDGSALRFNTNTVFNAALSFRLNWDGRFRSLEEQIQASLESPEIMATSIPEVLQHLDDDRELKHQFQRAYGHDPDQASLLDSIATYERSLVTTGSRFDLWLNGDASALNAQEMDGYNLFKSLGCVSCHQGVNVGGNLFERHGIFRPLASPSPAILRVPSLRNIATTPPYFHDGSAATLDEAVRKMGDAQLDRSLSTPQIDAVVAFLKTLTGTCRGLPVVAPSP